MQSENKKIARNTLMLYFRQILILLTSLYTVRIVLQALGAEDYGIYNVVAGTVTMFGFLSSSMATASQRFFCFEIGQGNTEKLQKIFSLTFIIYLILAVLLFAFAETVGLYFLRNKLVIPEERLQASFWIYQFTIFSFIITILTTPYMAAIIAHENMKIYAYAGIAEAALKFGVALSLKFLPFDNLISYGFLLMIVTSINTAFYRFFCTARYPECRLIFIWDKEKIKEIISYSSWNLFGSSVGIIKNQVLNILLNIFFNPIVNAARSISIQVNNAVNSFAINFTTAMRPQIIKQYAAGNFNNANRLVSNGCKYTFFLMLIFSMPLILEMNYVLKIWLSNPPESAAVFTRLALIDAVITSISYQIMTLAQATGKIKLYQSLVGSILLMNLPMSFLILKLGAPAYSVMTVTIIISCIATAARLLIIKLLTPFSITAFFANSLLPIFCTTSTACIIPTIIHFAMPENFIRFCIVVFTSIFMMIFCIITIGLSRNERIDIIQCIKKKFSNNRK